MLLKRPASKLFHSTNWPISPRSGLRRDGTQSPGGLGVKPSLCGLDLDLNRQQLVWVLHDPRPFAEQVVHERGLKCDTVKRPIIGDSFWQSVLVVEDAML